MRGQNCPHCKHYISNQETEFLNLIQIPNQNRQLYIGKYKIDGIKDNVIYEFLGDYWHGNPQRFPKNDMNQSCNTSFGELFSKTIHKFNALKNMGYKIRYIWESDWKQYIKNNIPTLNIQEYI